MAVMASPFGSPTKCARIAQAAQGGGRVRHVIHNRSYASDILTIGTASRERNVSPSNANKLTNPVKERLRAGDVALGITVRISRTPDIARIAKATGHDFIFIDTQHSIFGIETIAAMAHTALAIGVAPLVRVRGIDDPDVSLLLDN